MVSVGSDCSGTKASRSEARTGLIASRTGIPRYREAAEVLVAKGAAYPCFCTPAELDERRKQAEASGRPPGYDGRCRSIEMSVAAARRLNGEPAAIRLAINQAGVTEFVDLIRGEIRVDHDNLDDFVLLRSDGRPTYHLASTVDDVDYEITHVARGEDLLPSTPRHIQLTLALGAEVPIYAHIPLIHGTDGKRLSKRHGAKAVTEFREAGYLPEALDNYLCLLGWSPGEDLTIFPLSLAMERFELSAVSKNPAVFDLAKLDWMNGEHVRALPCDGVPGEGQAVRRERDRTWSRAGGVEPLRRIGASGSGTDQAVVGGRRPGSVLVCRRGRIRR